MDIFYKKPVTQKHPMGCAVACVAYILSIEYENALKLFTDKRGAWSKGFYCNEIVEALSNGGLHNYDYKEIEIDTDIPKQYNMVVFAERCIELPEGHFLVSTPHGWMDPWVNHPFIVPAKSGYVKNLPSKPSWIVYQNDV
jgi:hypothetical protein